MKISVVVPVYRVPAGMLRACADSLSGQTLADMEFLFVLDGPDAEADQVLAEAARQDPRLRILRNETNCGVSAARNRGLAAAQGDWFGFVDADDAVAPETYAGLLALAEDAHCDLVGCRLTYGGTDRGEVLPIHGFAGTFALQEDAAAAKGLVRAGLSCCTKLFARKTFGALRFAEAYGHLEDGIFLHQALCQTERIGFVDAAWYHARRRSDSAQHRPVDFPELERCYGALEEMRQQADRRSAGMRRLRRTWAHLLLSWSVGSRRFHEELPLETRAAGMDLMRGFMRAFWAAFGSDCPVWLRRMVDWKLAAPERLYGGGNLFYSLLWQEIRRETAFARGETRALAVRDIAQRFRNKLRG